MFNLGTIILMTKKWQPKNFLPCDGRLIDLNPNQGLYTVIGAPMPVKSYGKDQFYLPKLDDKFGCHYLICTSGFFPENTGISYHEVNFEEANFIGMIAPLKGETIPDGWMLCDGKQYHYYLNLEEEEAQNPLLANAVGDYRMAGKHGYFYDSPNTGNERYVICVEGMLPLLK
jgi:microcystin-dependent protein